MTEPNFKKTCTFLRQTTDKHRWGLKQDGTPKPRATFAILTSEINDYYEKCRAKSGRIVSPKTITNARFLGHYNYDDSLYFYGITSGVNSDGTSKIGARSLVMFDIDCHEKGNGDPKIFVRWLADRMPWFAQAFQEGSNRGWHSYGVFHAEGKTNRKLCQMYNRANNLMKREFAIFLRSHGPIISGAEVKGRPCELIQRNGRMEIKTGGTLALYPRNPAFFTSCPIHDKGEFDEVIQKCVVITDAMLDEWETRLDREDAQPTIKMPAEKKKAMRVGSCSDHYVPASENYQNYIQLAEQLMPESLRCVGGRHLVTAIDLAILLMILKYCRPYQDGSMPMSSIQHAWEKLYAEGKIPRGWNPNRYVVMRNLLTDLGYIQFQDTTYTPPTYKMVNGERVRDQLGLACKWQVSEELMASLGKKNKRPENKQIGLNTRPFGLVDATGKRRIIPPKMGPRPRYISRKMRFLEIA